ncbi:MAG: primosomal protein N' [Candidatus Margulisbacteria bacterium]|nr:primosomal protein N' [Candidatus Margulisiibacteriota bacterium]
MYAEVLLAQQIQKSLSYQVPEHLADKVKIGQAVEVPVKNRNVLGYIYRLQKTWEKKNYELKEISSLKSEYSFFDDRVVELLEWISRYYAVPLSLVLKSVLPAGAKNLKNFKIDFEKIKTSESLQVEYSFNTLTAEQEKVFQTIITNKEKNHLIQGITGSGKSEIYIKTIAHYFSQGKSSLYLVPEIALSYSIYEKLQKNFGDKVILLHSQLTPKERMEAWLKIYHSPLSIVIGARSAVFTPIQSLGLIVIDEEQENSYKQEQTPRYNAKAVAFKKAEIHKAQLVVGTATPLISTYYLARKHFIISTLNKRFTKTPLPDVRIINLKNSSYPKNLLTLELVKEIRKTLEQKEQVILLFNQRGLVKSLRCEDCGEPVLCRRCSVTMTLHENNQLKCHYCGLIQEKIEVCPNCKSFKLTRFGKGIQALQQELKKTFPYARIKRLDSDISAKAHYLEDTLKAFEQKEIDILVGTQMIAKGHHFPEVTLVGVIDADLNLCLPDIYAAERTYDLLTQVIGRSGRGSKKGTVLMQTFNPGHDAIKYAVENNYEAFFKHELQIRKETQNPPFTRLIRISFENRDAQKVEEELESFHKFLSKNFSKLEFLNPIPSLINKIKNRFRWHFIIKIPGSYNTEPLKKQLQESLVSSKFSSRMIYDVDPVDVLM